MFRRLCRRSLLAGASGCCAALVNSTIAKSEKAPGSSKSAAQPRALLYETLPFSPETLSDRIDVNNCTHIEVPAGSELYKLVCNYLVEDDTVQGPCARRFERFHSSLKMNMESEPGSDLRRRATATLGLGLFEFDWRGQTLLVLHQTVGEPVGCSYGVEQMRSLVLLARGRESMPSIQDFVDSLLEAADRADADKFTVYRWIAKRNYWNQDATVPARPLDSVVLPENTKAKVIADLDDFVAPDTLKWYREHGIPYKRAYLFHGFPGSGKTSLIQALAGRYHRNVCYLSPTDPDMTDDNLKSAVQRCPAKSLLVLEDVDGLFSYDRRKKVIQSPLTFSGLLNAIDGVGSSTGQIFVLTTNVRDELDPALTRNGRVDCHVYFGPVEPDQMRLLFRQFYPDSDPALASSFQALLAEKLTGRELTMAALQQYFITMRKRSAAEAASSVELIVEDLDERGSSVWDKRLHQASL